MKCPHCSRWIDYELVRRYVMFHVGQRLGAARSAALSPKRRSEIASKAARARWAKVLSPERLALLAELRALERRHEEV